MGTFRVHTAENGHGQTQSIGMKFKTGFFVAMLTILLIQIVWFEIVFYKPYEPLVVLSGRRMEEWNSSLPIRTPNSPFVFIHVPKTAGTTLTEFMKNIMRQRCIEVPLDVEPSIQIAVKEAAKLTALAQIEVDAGRSNREAVASVQASNKTSCFFTHVLAGPDFDARVRLLEVVVRHGVPFRYILGHYPYGYCSLAEAGCSYVTVLREPLDRLHSHYQYLMRMHPAYVKDMCKGGCNDFSQFVHSLANGTFTSQSLDNMQTRMIAGDGFWASLSGFKVCQNGLEACDARSPAEVTQDTLELAKENIRRHFAVVGVTEHLHLFKLAMEAVFGYPSDDNHYFTTEFMNNNRHKKFNSKSLDPVTYDLLVQTQQYDIQLYDFVSKLVMKQYPRVKERLEQRKASAASFSRALR